MEQKSEARATPRDYFVSISHIPDHTSRVLPKDTKQSLSFLNFLSINIESRHLTNSQPYPSLQAFRLLFFLYNFLSLTKQETNGSTN